ncbi:MAG: SGNH/GDSL hydrolase family protein [Clostridium sp.]|uniref:SGNH/GDSL hydrolase family protein n=1 Tax=Clostridium sp. TaxID=1506 RepID=UPI00304F7C5C
MFREDVTIKVIGDSIAAGAGASDSVKSEEVVLETKEKVFFRRKGRKSWLGLFEEYLNDKFPNCSIINNGCGGINSTQIRENLSALYSKDDDVIILMVGANDRKQKDGMNILFENLTYMVRFFKQNNKKVILMSSPPSTAENESYPNRLFHNEDVNNVVACVAENEEVLFINHYKYIQEYLLYTGKTIDEVMVEENCMNDGLHPTDKVHYLMFRNLIQNLNLAVKVNGNNQ